MGMRQSFGLLQPHMVRDLGITTSDFSFALAIQNIVWGVTQPFVGMAADRWGVRWVTLAGVAIYGLRPLARWSRPRPSRSRSAPGSASASPSPARRPASP